MAAERPRDHQDAPTRSEGDLRFPARSRLRHVASVEASPGQDHGSPVVDAARRFKGLQLRRTAPGQPESPATADSEDMIRQLDSMEQRLKRMLGFLGGSVEEAPRLHDPGLAASPEPGRSADPGEEALALLDRAGGYQLEWSSLTLDEQEADDSLPDFARSSYVDLLERHFHLCFLLLDSTGSLLRICHAELFPRPFLKPEEGERLHWRPHSLAGWVLISPEGTGPPLPALRRPLFGGSLLVFPPGHGIQEL